MDTFLFQDLVPLGQRPLEGPQNIQRDLIYFASIWLEGPHESYPRCEFSEYPTIRGWDRAKLKRGRWRDAHPHNASRSDSECVVAAVSMIQSWLTLGFLESVFQKRIPIEKYTRLVDVNTDARMKHVWETSGQGLKNYFPRDVKELRIFHTEQLVGDLFGQYMLNQFQPEIDPARYRVLFGNAWSSLAEALRDFNALDVYQPERNRTLEPQSPDTEDGFALHMMLPFPTLLGLTTRLHLPSLAPDEEIEDPRVFNELQVKSLINLYRWCPFTLQKLRITAGYTVLYWMWAHGFQDLSGVAHDNCDKNSCTAYRVEDESAYPIKHVEPCTGHCGRFFPVMDTIKTIYESGGTPIFVARKSIDKSTGSRLYSFEIFRSDPSDPLVNSYTAFSHVWADGFGSTSEQGMPRCQVNFLAEAAFAVSSKSSHTSDAAAFWIDSLAIPSNRLLRRKAIESMATTYKSAAAVIVLDRTLQKCTFTPNITSPESLLFRIYTCPWMNRVWTYQEGALASTLYFKLSGSASDPSIYIPLEFPSDAFDIRGPLHISMGHDQTHDVYMYLRAEVQNLNGAIRPINIGHAALELRWRDTLHRNPKGKNDEVLAVAVLLGLDVHALLSVPEGEERMRKFLLLCGRVPRNLIFSESRGRLPFEGFRWAPNTFLVRDPRRLSTDLERNGVLVTEGGLRGGYTVFGVNGGRLVHWVPNRRQTLIHGAGNNIGENIPTVQPRCWFDLIEANREPFTFTHIIIYPESIPSSRRGTMFVAAAVVQEDLDDDSLSGEDVDLVCRFERVVHLCVFRDWTSPPPQHLDPTPVVVQGRFGENVSVLLR